VLIARFILVALICECPAILLWDGLITQSLITGAVAAALLVTARSLRPGETKFFVSIIGPFTAAAVVPALWMVVQVIPLRAFAHPIWKSAEAALGKPLTGTISIDLGNSIIALDQYLSVVAVVFLASAIAVDRQRAASLLFALTGAASLVALVALSSVWLPSGAEFPQFMPGSGRCRGYRNDYRDCGWHSGDRTLRDAPLNAICARPYLLCRWSHIGALYLGSAVGGNLPSVRCCRVWLRDAGVDKNYAAISALRIGLHVDQCIGNDCCAVSHHNRADRTQRQFVFCVCDVIFCDHGGKPTHAK